MIAWLMIVFLASGQVVTERTRDYNSCWGLASVVFTQYNQHYNNGYSPPLSQRDFICQPYYAE